MHTPPATAPIVIAHRGASGYRPEHTLSAFRLAIEQGADAVEPDLVATSDGVLVIRHENEISGTTDVASHPEFASRRATKVVDGVSRTGWFTEDFTWDELSILRAREPRPRIRPDSAAHDGREGILRFEQLLELVRIQDRAVDLVAELKHPTHFAALGLNLDGLLVSALAEAGWTDGSRLTVESFELSILKRIRARGLQARFIYLIEAHGAPADDPSVPFASFLTDDALVTLASVVDGISVNKKLLLDPDVADATLIERAHAAGLLVYCWTLRPENRFLAPRHRIGAADRDFGDWEAEFGVLLASGIDGVFTDHPDLAVEARARARLSP